MRAALSEEQLLMVETAGRMARDGVGAAQSVMQGDGWPAEPDDSLLRDWSGLGISESRGGAGGGLVDLALVISTLGSAIVPNRFTTHVLAMQVAAEADLPVDGALSGAGRWCLAADESGAGPFGPFRCARESGKLIGVKTGVAHGAGADLAVVVLSDDRVALGRPDSVQPLAAANPLTPAADLSFDGSESLALGRGARRGLLRACALLAAELCGIARGALDLGAGYARERVQFGKPIGAFQGVAHQLSDALVAVETAWSLTLYACWAMDRGTQDASKAVHAAKARACEAAVFSAERALHVHGGMGMTWEAPLHLYLRRALAASARLGGPHWHRRRVGELLLSGVANGKAEIAEER